MRREDKSDDRYISRRRVLQTTGTTAIVGLAGCISGQGSSNQSSSNQSSSNQSENGNDASKPPKPNSITVRDWGGSWQENLHNAIGKPFEEATGISIKYDNTSEEVMHGKIRTAVKQDREPPVDINYTTTPLAYKAHAQGFLQTLDTNIVSNVEDMSSKAKPNTDASWPFTNLTAYTYTLSYNTEEIEEKPESWEDIWWKNGKEKSIGLYTNGTGSTPFIAKMSGTKLGPAKEMKSVWEKYRQLKPNVGHIGDDTSITQSLRKGEIESACLIASNPLNAQKNGAPIEWTVPKEGAVAKLDSLVVPKNVDEKHSYWGQKFINTALQAENLANYGEGMGLAPLNPNSSLPKDMEKSTAFPTSKEQFDELITVDSQTYVKHSSDWFSKFNNIMKS